MLDASEFKELLTTADRSFVTRSAERMQLGEEKYGPFKFLEADTLEEAMQEVLDLGNYARMTYIRLYLLQSHLAKLAAESPAVTEKGFVPMKEFLQK
jgi:hypothetical protein